MKRIFLFFALAVAAVSTLTVSCSKDPEPVPATDAIVAILGNAYTDHNKQLMNSITAECYNKGITVIGCAAESDKDIETQMQAINNIQTNTFKKSYNVIGIIVSPIRLSDDDYSVEKAVNDYAAGRVPVVVLDAEIRSNSPLRNTFLTYVGTDNEKAGAILADKIKESGDEILAVLQRNSGTANMRYEGFDDSKAGSSCWITTDDTVQDQILDRAEDKSVIVFFNGNLCSTCLDRLDGKKVYSFDAYNKPFVNLMSGGDPIEALYIQNTFEMGRKAVDAFFNAPASKYTYVDPIYTTTENIKGDELAEFRAYFIL